MKEIYIIRNHETGAIAGIDQDINSVRRFARQHGYVFERFVKAPPAEIPVGFVGKLSMDSGIATLEDGTYVNLLEVQAVINGAFQEHGNQEYADAADALSKVTGLVQGPHGEWEAA